jgi:hypothetical protein
MQYVCMNGGTTTATDPDAPEIMAGLPPVTAVMRLIHAAAMMPLEAGRLAMSAQDTASGTSTSAMVAPASASVRYCSGCGEYHPSRSRQNLRHPCLRRCCQSSRLSSVESREEDEDDDDDDNDDEEEEEEEDEDEEEAPPVCMSGAEPAPESLDEIAEDDAKAAS